MSGITSVHFSHRGGHLSRLDDEGGKSYLLHILCSFKKIGSRDEDEEIFSYLKAQ